MVKWLRSLAYFALDDEVVDGSLEFRPIKETCDANEGMINPSMAPNQRVMILGDNQTLQRRLLGYEYLALV